MSVHESEASPSPAEPKGAGPRGFLEAIVREDVAQGRHGGRVHTRFPPEPNGYLHIGHAKAIWLNFTLAERFPGGKCNLRFDDTNPAKESAEFVAGIREDLRWLGFDWEEREYFASDYFEQLYAWAEELIEKGRAYVDDQSAQEIRAGRGSLTEPGVDSPFRDRPPAESLELFRRMHAGEFDEGARCLRARIDMRSPHLVMRDPVIYRVLRAAHHRTGTRWCVYPTYDFAHGQSDAIEGITHSICTLEFENHRPLYDWFLEQLSVPSRPRQYEFARQNVSHTVTSKRKLAQLVADGHVDGWDDPRMPTLRGLRRRGFTPEAIRAFCERTGVTRVNGIVDAALLMDCLREDLNQRAPRRMGVLRPLELVIENWPADRVEELDALENPQDEGAGTRRVAFGGRLWIEREDFREQAPRKYHRLAPGQEVRLRYAYYVTCTGFERDAASGEVTRVLCTYDPATRGGDSPDGRKVKGTIHWVFAERAVEAEVRLYDHLFDRADPEEVGEGEDFRAALNPASLEVVGDARLEPAVLEAAPGEPFQLERHGYFVLDTRDSQPGRPVLNRSVALRDSWAKIERREAAGTSG